MLTLKNVSIGLQQSGRPIIENFNFTLNSREKAVVIGEEGNGKSTLLKYIYNKRLLNDYCECSGTVVTDGILGYLPQSMEACPDSTVSEYFAAAEFYSHMDVLGELGLSVDFVMSSQKLKTLSGGEKVKVQLAKLLMCDPDILLLDEPTNDLDIETLEWMEHFIRQTPLPVLFVSHDETLIENTANVIIHMEQLCRKSKCRITVVRTNYREYLSRRQANQSKREQIAQKQRDDYEKQMEKYRQIYNRVNHEQKVITRQDPGGARLLKKKMHSVLSMGKRFEREKENFLEFPQSEDAILTQFSDQIHIPAGKTVLDFSLDSLVVGNRLLAHNIRLFVSGSEHIGITGKNGAGKSTLLAEIWKQLRHRKDITPCYMPQDYAQKLNYDSSPIEFLSDCRVKEELTRARTYLGSMRFTHEEMTGKIGALSGGQKAKILFLDMVLQGADVLILDEPTRNFSPLSGPVVRSALENFGGAIISVSHDRKYLQEVCYKVYELTADGLVLIKENAQHNETNE